MDSLLLTERTLTELDHARLKRLLMAGAIGPRDAAGAALHAAMDGADLLPSRAVPPDVVTMYSRVELVEAPTGARHLVTLCYPEDAEPARGFISVLSPLGSSVLGLRAGSLATWSTPGGGEVQARVAAVLFQPEASGDFVL
jgi:regulator of nucleoside diphosphate kinase